jgi:hypothetical protein
MKNRVSSFLFISCLVASVVHVAYASNPASKEWVMQQIAANQRVLTAADWAAVCTSGSPTSTGGCYGNVSSAAFTKVSGRLGGFTTYANINLANVASSVFIKSFLGGTNIPVNANYFQINISNSAARCGVYTQAGFGLGIPGVATSTPSSGSDAGLQPNNASVISINNALSNDVFYNNQGSPSTVGGPQQSDPLYLVCAGYNPANGSSAASINVTAV